jgi:hypothetical protein
MMIDSHYSPQKVSIILDGDSPVSALAFGLSSAIEWMMVHGVHTFGIQMLKEGSHRSLLITAKCKPTEMFGSPMSTMQGLIDIQRLAPAVSDMPSSDDWTAVESDVSPNQSIADYAFTVAELITNFFVRGICNAIHECSVSKSLILFEEGITKSIFDEISEEGYKPALKVKELP